MILLQALSAPTADLFLGINNGQVTGGPINVLGLGVFGRGGSVTLTGTVGGNSGVTAAQVALKNPALDGRYRINSCVIATVGCIVLPATTPVAPALITNVSITQQSQQFTDPTVDVLNIGTEDLF